MHGRTVTVLRKTQALWQRLERMSEVAPKRHSRCEPGTFPGVVEEETKIKDYIVIIFLKMSLCTGSEEARCPILWNQSYK